MDPIVIIHLIYLETSAESKLSKERVTVSVFANEYILNFEKHYNSNKSLFKIIKKIDELTNLKLKLLLRCYPHITFYGWDQRFYYKLLRWEGEVFTAVM